MADPREVVRAYLRRLEERDLDGLDDVVDEGVVVRKPDGTVAFDDRSAWKQALAEEPFADIRIEVEELICEGDRVALRYQLECVHFAPVFGVEPTGRRITTSGTKIYRVRDGRIVEIAGPRRRPRTPSAAGRGLGRRVAAVRRDGGRHCD